MEEISDHAKNLTLSEDLEKPLEERVNIFYNFVKVIVPRLWILNEGLITLSVLFLSSSNVAVMM